MKVLIPLVAILSAVSAQQYLSNDIPLPYSYSYVADGDEGSSTHQETGDGNGNVQGSYSLSDIDGRNRVVEYIADAGGFRAVVRTNEPGTASQNPADVVFESSAQPGVGGGLPASRPRPATGGRVGGGAGSGQGVRYVLVPVTDPRAQGYY